LQEGEQAWAAREIAGLWSAKAGAGAMKAESLQAHAALYLKLLATDKTLALPRNEPLVKRSRETLKRLPPEYLTLERIISEVGKEDYELTLAGIVGGTVPELKSTGRVRGAFTKKGFDERARAKLDAGAQDSDAWVLTSSPQAVDPDAAIVRLRSLY